MKQFNRIAQGLVLAGLFTLLLIGCGQGDAVIEEVAEAETAVVAEAETSPTEAPTEAPTETAEPTNTPTTEPTSTPTTEPTNTPTTEPTSTPTAEPTNTPTAVPPTNTPAPTQPPAPTAPPAEPTAVPEEEVGDGDEEEERPDSVTVYYISNPNDILGVFPVTDFDAGALYNNMLNIRNSLGTMRNSVGGTLSEEPGACDTYVSAYNNILYSGVFYDEVPADWQEIDSAYFVSFIYALDRTRPAYLSCVDSGKVDRFNYDLAFLTIEQTINFFTPYVDAAAAKQ